MTNAASDLPTMITDSTARTASGSLDQDGRVEQHADRDEEQDGEGILKRQRIGGRAVAEIRLVQHHARKERAERERDAEHLGRAIGDAQASASTDSVNSSREPVRAACFRNQGTDLRAEQHRKEDECRRP